MEKIIGLPQFQKRQKGRKNKKPPILKEEERILSTLKDEGKISEALFTKLRPRGSLPPRLYGLAKVHKDNTPMRPVLSMPGSPYHNIGLQVAEWLSQVPECRINSSSTSVCDSLKTIQLDEQDEVVSFDVSALYTNVPVVEAIETCADLLFEKASPPVDKETFITLATMASCDVLMSTHDGYYRQVDGLAMGSPPASHLANGWMSKFDQTIKGGSKMYTRYMDDILCDVKSDQIGDKLQSINSIHPALKFTVEREHNKAIPFLDLKIINDQGRLSSTWYYKPTDTGLIMNYHALAPKRYKRSVVSGFVHRIYRACSAWILFHESLEKAKKILEQNQYPPVFYEPIIEKTLTSILSKENTEKGKELPKSDTGSKFLLRIQYRGKSTEDYARSLHRVNAPCMVVMTLRKLKTTLPSIKPPLEKMLRSGLVYKLQCPCCDACYVGQTSRHLQSRFREHTKNAGPMKSHLQQCAATLQDQDVQILSSTSRGETYLMTLEALWIRELDPTINTKDEYRSRGLAIKL